RALRLRAQPEDAGALQRLRARERHLRLLARPGGVAFLETHLGLVGVVEREFGVRGADALGEPPRAPGGEPAPAGTAQLPSRRALSRAESARPATRAARAWK